MIEVALTTLTEEQAFPPTVTVAPATKFAPVKTRGVPPEAGPVAGSTVVNEGAGTPDSYK